jgi:hypothetical protein
MSVQPANVLTHHRGTLSFAVKPSSSRQGPGLYASSPSSSTGTSCWPYLQVQMAQAVAVVSAALVKMSSS